MQSSVRLLNREVSSLYGPRSLYLCSTCKQEIRPRPFPVVHHHYSRRNNSSGPLSFTERMRRKIWGTDKPPGAKDPYGGSGIIEQTFREKLGSSKETEEEPDRSQHQSALNRKEDFEDEPEDIAPPDEYVPAETWDGIERMGHLGRWSDLPPTEADTFTPFCPKKKLDDMKFVSLAAHQAAVEVAIMHALKKPLANVCNVLEHPRYIIKYIRNCKIQKPKDSQWDKAVIFPSDREKNGLFAVFEQIGNSPSRAELAGDVMDDNGDRPKDPKHFLHGNMRLNHGGYRSMPLTDPATKFAFLKRLSQLSGHFFPDSAAQSFTTVEQSVNYINGVLHPKPDKLVTELFGHKNLHNLLNVKIYPRRQTMALKDEELGRRKLIDSELRARGLVDRVTSDGRAQY